MLFNAHEFLFIFLPIVLAGFFVIGRLGRHRLAVAWLVLLSLTFYAWWKPAYLPVLLGSLVFNYAVGTVLAALSRRHGPRTARAKGLLVFGIAANIVLLGYFKYANFLVENINALLSTTMSMDRLLLPLAISFFTFQQIAYLVDAWRGEAADADPLRYALFVSFFPQLIAGPIVHHREMMPQFARRQTFSPRTRHIAVGLTIFFIGLFKKTVLADGMATIASPLFAAAGSGTPLTIAEGWLAALSYTFQLYFDFSGYSDMAIGLARMFGVQLPINFNSPYKAASITDFWRRWHITLSRFLRDYIYVPLGGSRKGPVRRYGNLMATMLIGGLWHGAGWTFVVWGGLHGLFLTINHLWSARFKAARRPSLTRRAAARALTFVAVVVAWVFFRATTFDEALAVLGAMAGGNGITVPATVAKELAVILPAWVPLAGGSLAPLLPDGGTAVLLVAIVGAVALWGPNTQQILWTYRPGLDSRRTMSPPPRPWRWRLHAGWATAAACIAALGILGMSERNEFLYFNF